MTSQKVEAYLRNKCNTIKEVAIAEHFQKLEGFYINKLWNQLSDVTKQLVRDPAFVSVVDMDEFYEVFIKDFQTRIHPLQLVELVIPIAEHKFRRGEKQAAFDFLGKFEKIVENDLKASVRLKSGQISLRLEDKDPKDNGQCREMALVRTMIEETEKSLHRLVEVGPVHATFYKVSAAYQRQVGDHAAYYVEALRYLSCENTELLSEAERLEHALLLCVAALLGEGVYNFGELLAHPILDELDGGPKEWLVQVLIALNAGDWDKFAKHKKQLCDEAVDIAHKMDLIEEKLRLLCLMEMAAKHPPKRRYLSFSNIAKTANLNEDGVELLVMKALANGLIQGHIDQVSQQVNITWVQPRALSGKQIAAIEARIKEWQKDVSAMEQLMETHASDILVAYT